MKNTRWFVMVLISILVFTGFAGRPVTAQEATPAATAAAAFDLKAAVQQFITTLPDGFYGMAATDALKAMQADPKPYLVDLRDVKEFGDGGFIAGAVNIPLPTLTRSLDKLPGKDSPIVVYCGIGHRGGMALVTLRLLGYTNVKSVLGGFTNWKNAKLPVAQGVPPAATSTGAKAPEYNPDLFAALDKFISGLPGDYYVIAPTAALKSLQDTPKPFLIDVREPKELATSGYIDGMINIPIRKLFDNLDKLPGQMDAPILTYCAIGHRGSMAMMALRLLGYTNVKSISLGFTGWLNNKLPIVAPVPATAAATAAR